MNSVRRLAAGGALAIGTLGLTLCLGAPTTFAATSYTSFAPNNAGRTTYSVDNSHYQIYDTLSDGFAVAAFFYNQDRQNPFKLFHTCNVGAGNSCQGDLPGGVAGPLCMATGVGNGYEVNNYEYGQSVCFNVSP